MKIVPGRINTVSTNINHNYQQSVKEKAVAMLTGAKVEPAAPQPSKVTLNQSQQHPVRNPSNVSAEETGGFSGALQKMQQKSQENAELATEVEAEAPVEQTAATESVDRQNTTSESAAVEETPAADPLSSQYANLARKEKALRDKARAQELALQQREAAIKAREEALNPQAAQSANTQQAQDLTKYISKDELKSNLMHHIRELGIDNDKLAELMLNQNSTDPMVMSELKALKAELHAEKEERKRLYEEQQKNATEQQTNAYQAALKQLSSEAKSLVAGNPEAYESIQAADAYDDVVGLIEATWKEEERMMGVEEAAQLVEEQLINEALKFARLKKVQTRLQPKPSTTEAQAEVKQVQQSQPAKTLNNQMSTGRPLSARERAIAAFHNGKK